MDKRERLIFHIDVNSAFLSWSAVRELEQGAKRDLRMIPSIVGGDVAQRRGIVLAKSIPAKAFGITTAQPVAQALQRCPNLVVVPPDHRYYREQSRKLMEFLTGITPQIEQVSVDECYMDFLSVADRYPSPEKAAHMIKDQVRKQFGFTVNVGISDRKVLAKMASDFQKPDRVHTLYVDEIQEKMWKLPVGELYMCGKSSEKQFQNLGIMTIGDLAQTDPRIVEAHLRSHGRLLWNYANGIDDSEVEYLPSKAKGVGNSTTLAKDLESREEAHQVLYELSKKVSARLKKAKFQAGSVCTEIKYATFQSVSHQKILTLPTSSEKSIAQTACDLFDELWDGTPIRLLGVRTTKLVDETEPIQMTIFDFARDQKTQKKREKQEKLDAALDQIRKRYGHDAVRKGNETGKRFPIEPKS